MVHRYNCNKINGLWMPQMVIAIKCYILKMTGSIKQKQGLATLNIIIFRKSFAAYKVVFDKWQCNVLYFPFFFFCLASFLQGDLALPWKFFQITPPHLYLPLKKKSDERKWMRNFQLIWFSFQKFILLTVSE